MFFEVLCKNILYHLDPERNMVAKVDYVSNSMKLTLTSLKVQVLIQKKHGRHGEFLFVSCLC